MPGSPYAMFAYSALKVKTLGKNAALYKLRFKKKDIGNKPSKAPISNHIYCTLICDLQLLSTKLHRLFVSCVGDLNMIFIPQWDSCSVVKKT